MHGQLHIRFTDIKHSVTLNTAFCCRRIQALVQQWDKYFNANGIYVDVWCVPMVLHVPYIYIYIYTHTISWNKFLERRGFATLLFYTSCSSVAYLQVC